jgi:hypothetical protein
VDEKIWRKEFRGPIWNFWKVVRTIFQNTFEFQGLCLEIHEVWLDSTERQGVICKMVGIFLVFELFSNRKYPSAYGPGLLWLTVDRGQMMRWWLTGAFARGWYEPQGLATRWGK